MHVIGIDTWAPQPGRVVRWTPKSDESPVPSNVPPSFNQRAHLADTEDGSTWLAATFDVDGPIDTAALERAFHRLVDRHDSLRTGFVRNGDDVRRVLHPRGEVLLRREDDSDIATTPGVRDALRAALDDACHPFAAPAYIFAAVDRADTSTVVCGFDHAHVDAYSLTIVIDEVRSAYLGREDVDTDDAGSFVDYCAAESASRAVRLDDPRVDAWVQFLSARGGAPPQFPLDLGVPVGLTDPSAMRVDVLMSAGESAEFESTCRNLGAGVYVGVLSAMAHAVRDLGGGSALPLLFPLHTRTTAERRTSIGWFVTNAPLTVSVGRDLMDTIERTAPDLRRAVDLGSVPIPRVVEAAGGLQRPRRNVFMVSYVDYRRLPAHDIATRIAAHHISNVTVADDAQFWLSRTSEGIALRSRFPDNAVAHAVIESFLAALGAHLGGAGHAVAIPGTPGIGETSVTPRSFAVT
ncbi:MAG: condensation domain-containing protein [Rhodococcus sp. (in: high G+C Gram-positive bacteria)]